MDGDRLARIAQPQGLYLPSDEHDACGVGLIASTDGTARREVVTHAIEALSVLFHRGAVDADGKTGDGAGLHVEIPDALLREHVDRSGSRAGDVQLAVGQVFLPRTDFEAQEACRAIVESVILEAGQVIFGWRQVPVDISVIGEKANSNRPEIEQIILGNAAGLEEEAFERQLYLIRRRIERRVREANIADFYICSLSCRSIIYKGMFLAEQLTAFYPDLTDERFVSRFAIYHQRYSTNTFPTWKLAQPFRMLAHNGEINTLKGNEAWMQAHEMLMSSPALGDTLEDLMPVIARGSSDSAALDAVFELLCRAGRTAPMTKTMLIPEAWENVPGMPDDVRALYRYAAAVMEPWDGPAGICACDGRWALGGMDRNGLRPMRYARTEDGLLVLGSEAGMVRLPDDQVVEKGRVGPGQMVAVDLATGRFYGDAEIKGELAAAEDFAGWTASIRKLDDVVADAATPLLPRQDREQLLACQRSFGLTVEDMELILAPMIEEAKEAIGSMGDDTPVAVLSSKYRGLHHFFRQNFSQVTNPPIDSLRERQVMSLRTHLGNHRNILEQVPSQCDVMSLPSPILSTCELNALLAELGERVAVIDCTFSAVHAHTPGQLAKELKRIRAECDAAVYEGKRQLVFSDQRVGAERVAVPMILATTAAHTHLTRNKTRTRCSLSVLSGEALDTHYCAVLIGVGATTVTPWLAEAAISDRHGRGLFGDLSLQDCIRRYKMAIDDGLLKIMSKMGIATLSSYRGGCNFEALGLSRALVAEYFPSCPSRLSGLGLNGLQKMVAHAHQTAYAVPDGALPIGGFYRVRTGGEQHAWEARSIHMLQQAVTTDNYALYQKYAKMVHDRPPVHLRDLLDFRPPDTAVAVEDVENITSIRKRFVTPGMSLGALSPEAHGTLNVAMNRIGAKSVSGEGGEDRNRYERDANGDDWNSAVKQVASGRFGVTAEYLNQCREIEIKMAQGAKPGEGGQLPGFKVTKLIARLRHSTPGVTLISPPPHHDIYSIEDLAQLIYDLKQINPRARVCVKLVARGGIGTIAAGVAKANADVILISGNNGGTGASPQTSIKYAGLPWEMGLAEAHQVLTLNRLRHRVTLRTDGGLKTGRDIVMAALLGAEEFGIGTASLVAMGCIMVRQCHSNTCPVGVCVQDEKLREHFTGTPEKVVNLMSFIAEEVREILATLGAKSLEEVIGRTDLLRQVSRGMPGANLDDLDLNPLLARAESGGELTHSTSLTQINSVPDTLDAAILEDARSVLEGGARMALRYTIRNTMRAIGTRLSSEITTRFGHQALPDGHITLNLRGAAGQSLGAFAVKGVRLVVEGEANDYVAKGLSGAEVIVYPPRDARREARHHAIIGNTVLYGATSGRLFAAGQAGERFCVRNSGAEAVVEGCGANGCEYMTGGVAVILGPVGSNFAAGMSGGMAFVQDPEDQLDSRLNAETVLVAPLNMDAHEDRLLALIEAHAKATGSTHAAQMLAEWEQQRRHFRHVVPKELLDKLDVPFDFDDKALRFEAKL